MPRLIHLGLLALLASCWTTAPEPVRHEVVRGDTLGELATAYGVTVDELRAWNELDGDLIEIGQVLVVQRGEAVGAAPVPAAGEAGRGSRSGRSTVEVPVATEGLVMPAEKACLGGPEDVEGGGEGMAAVASRGLSRAQVKAAFDAFVPKTTACLPDGWTGTTQVDVDLTIACTGRVADVSFAREGGLSDEVLACLADRLRYAAFPAHDLPDGERARVPLRFVGE